MSPSIAAVISRSRAIDEPESLRRRGSVRGFDPAALAPTPSPEINPPQDISPVREWRIVPEQQKGQW